MKISNNLNAAGVGGPVPPKRPVAAPSNSAEAASFDKSAALEAALKSTPDSRPEAVARARALLSDAAYPPPETLQKISKLLAGKTGGDGE